MPLLVWQIFYSGMLNSIVNQNVEIQNIFNLALTLIKSHV